MVNKLIYQGVKTGTLSSSDVNLKLGCRIAAGAL